MNEDITGELVLFLGGKCALCDKPYPDKKAWTVHHRRYRKNEKKYSDFIEKIPHTITRGKRKGKKTTKKIYHKQEYLIYLRKIIYGRPSPKDDFAPMHNSCHQAISRGARWSKKSGNRQRFCDLIMEQE